MPNAKVKAKDSSPPYRLSIHCLSSVAMSSKSQDTFLFRILPFLIFLSWIPEFGIKLLNRLLYIFVIFDIYPKGPSQSKSIHVGIDWIGSLSYRSGSIVCVWPRTARTTRCELCIRSISAEAKELLFVLRWKCANVPVILLNLMVERTVSFKVVCWLQLQRLSLICQIEKLAQLFAIKLWWRKLIRLTNF